MTQLGIPFSAIDSNFDEDSIKKYEKNVRDLTRLLCKEKALNVFNNYPDNFVIGSDQAVEIDGIALGKPKSFDKAIDQLKLMSGKKHYLWTSYALIDPSKKLKIHTQKTVLTMKKISEDEIVDYVGYDFPVDCAGSYKIECAGIALFEKIETTDFSAIQGLPLMELAKDLKLLEFKLFQKEIKR